MSNYYEYRDVKVNIAHRLMDMDGWVVEGYKPDESDSMTDYWSPADWSGIATKNGYTLVIDQKYAKDERRYTVKTSGSNENAEKIKKLEAITQARGASVSEEETARAKIEILRAKDEAGTVEKEVIEHGHLANPPRCNWHIEKNGIIYDKGTGLLKYDRVPDISYPGELKDWQTFNNTTPEEYKKEWITYQINRGWYSNEEEAAKSANRVYKEVTAKYKLLDKFNELLARFNNVCGGLVGNSTEAYTYEEITKTEYKTEIRPVETSGSLAEGQCFIVKKCFNYGIFEGYVYRIHARENSAGGVYYYANRLNGKNTKELTGIANRANYWPITPERFMKWIEKGALAFCTLEEVKTPYEVKKVVKKKITETVKEDQKTEVENMKTEEKTVAKYNELEDIGGFGVMFDIKGHHEIRTAGSGYYVVFNIDTFNKTTGAVSDPFDTFEQAEQHLFEIRTGCERVDKPTETAPADEISAETDAAEDIPTEEENAPDQAENTPETATEAATETATETAPAGDMFAELAKAYATGKQAPKRSEKTTETKPEEPTPEEKPNILSHDIERGGASYTVTAEKTSGAFIGSEGYTVSIKDQNGETVKQETTTSGSEARRLFWQYCEIWSPAPGYTGNNNDVFTPEELTALSAGTQVRKGEGWSTRLYYTVDRGDIRLVYSFHIGSDEKPRLAASAYYEGFMLNNNYYSNNDPIFEKMKNDINKKIFELIPDEATAAEKITGEPVDDWKKRDIETYTNTDYTPEAQRLFYEEKAPALYLYRDNPGCTEDMIKYLRNPESIVDEYAADYIKEHAVEIYINWISYNRKTDALNKIIDDKTREEHTLLKISKTITDEKTVRVELTNGHEVKVEADGVKGITRCGYISEWRVAVSDRKYLRVNEYNRPDDIRLSDIKTIKHGSRVLYAT